MAKKGKPAARQTKPVAYFYMEIDIRLPSDDLERRQILQKVNAAWGWNPTSFEDAAPEGLKEVHWHLNATNRTTIRIAVDRSGGMKIVEK